jgi:hypothetical protein
MQHIENIDVKFLGVDAADSAGRNIQPRNQGRGARVKKKELTASRPPFILFKRKIYC